MSVLSISFVWYKTIPLTKSGVCWITSSTLVNPVVYSSIPSSLSADCFSQSPVTEFLSVSIASSLVAATVPSSCNCWHGLLVGCFCSSVPSSTLFSTQWQRFFLLKNQPHRSFILPGWFLSLPTKETLIWLLEFFMLILPQIPLLDFSLSLRILFLSRYHLESHALTVGSALKPRTSDMGCVLHLVVKGTACFYLMSNHSFALNNENVSVW